MEAFARFIVRFRVAILVVSALMTLGAGALMTRLKVDTDFANYISPDDPIVQRVRQAGEVFGSSHTVVVLVESKDSFAPEIVQAIARLTKGFRNEPGVSSVMSLTNIVDIKKTASGLEVADLIPSQALGDPAALAEVKRYTQGKSSYSSFLVSADGQFTAIYINIAESAKKDEVAKRLRVVTETLWPEASRPAKVHFAGEPMIMNYLDRIIVQDMVVLVPLVVLLLLGILYFSFRTLRGVVLPMLAVLMATVVTFGIMGLAGSPLTIIAAIMPVVLISNGSAYGIHMLNFISLSYDQNRDSAGAVRVALGLVTVPIMNSAITTFIGFMSFVMGLLTIFESFGIYTAIGIAASLLFALTFIPAVVCCLKPPAASAKSGDEGATAATFLSRPLAAVAHMIHDHPRAVLAVAAATTLAAAPGIFRLQSDFDMLSFFKETSEPRQADALMTREFGGTMAYMIHVKGPVKDPLVLGEIYRLQKHLRHTLGSTRVNSRFASQ